MFLDLLFSPGNEQTFRFSLFLSEMRHKVSRSLSQKFAEESLGPCTFEDQEARVWRVR